MEPTCTHCADDCCCEQPAPTFGDELIIGDHWTVVGPDAPGTYREED